MNFRKLPDGTLINLHAIRVLRIREGFFGWGDTPNARTVAELEVIMGYELLADEISVYKSTSREDVQKVLDEVMQIAQQSWMISTTHTVNNLGATEEEG